ncbi:hypothetical protein CsatB_014566 [Cannabis sativa]
MDMDSYYTTRQASQLSKKIKSGLLDKWLTFAVENKIKEIHLWLDHFYTLPNILVDNARYLTILELNWVKLDTSHSFSFPSLKSLSLKGVRNSKTAKYDGVVKFLSGSPSLEKLHLHDYEFLSIDDQSRLQSLSLKFFELSFSDIKYELKIQVRAINLESLLLHGVAWDEINISSCKKIRNLTFADHTFIYDQPSLEVVVSNISLVENLILSDSNTHLDHLKISSEYFESLKFKYLYDMINAFTMESAPELAYFCYKGNMDRCISIESSNLLNGKIVFCEDKMKYDTDWFTNMLNSLVNLNCSWNILSLHVSSYEVKWQQSYLLSLRAGPRTKALTKIVSKLVVER